MKTLSIKNTESIQRKYGIMKILAGGRSEKMKSVNIDLKILEIEPQMSTSQHYHKKSETVFYVLKGKVKLDNKKETLELKKGDIVLIPPYEFHRLININQTICVVLEVMSPTYRKSDIFETN